MSVLRVSGSVQVPRGVGGIVKVLPGAHHCSLCRRASPYLSPSAGCPGSRVCPQPADRKCLGGHDLFCVAPGLEDITQSLAHRVSRYLVVQKLICWRGTREGSLRRRGEAASRLRADSRKQS